MRHSWRMTAAPYPPYGFCLDLCLAAQGDSFEQARQKLSAMIEEYVYDAPEGKDQAHAPQLLSRKAPAGYWLKYYWYMLLAKAGMLGGEIRKSFELYKVTVDCPKEPFTRDLIKWMCQQAGVSKKQFYAALK